MKKLKPMQRPSINYRVLLTILLPVLFAIGTYGAYAWYENEQIEEQRRIEHQAKLARIERERREAERIIKVVGDYQQEMPIKAYLKSADDFLMVTYMTSLGGWYMQEAHCQFTNCQMTLRSNEMEYPSLLEKLKDELKDDGFVSENTTYTLADSMMEMHIDNLDIFRSGSEARALRSYDDDQLVSIVKYLNDLVVLYSRDEVKLHFTQPSAKLAKELYQFEIELSGQYELVRKMAVVVNNVLPVKAMSLQYQNNNMILKMRSVYEHQ